MSHKIVQVIFALLGVGLTLLIIFAALEAPLSQSFARITEDLWGWTTLADLYIGFLLIAFIIAVFEQNKAIAAFWIVPLFFLGNVWSVLWLVLRFQKITDRLNARP